MKTFFLKAFAVAGLIAAFSGCKKNETKCEYNPCSTVAPAAEIQAVQDYITSHNLVATQHCSGMFYHIDTEGTGKNPNGCSTVAASYKGTFTNGATFDQSASPVSFSLQGVIQGWTNGLPLIKEGGKITLYIPPSLGYGDKDVRDANGNVAIPANSILIFEVNLAGVR